MRDCSWKMARKTGLFSFSLFDCFSCILKNWSTLTNLCINDIICSLTIHFQFCVFKTLTMIPTFASDCVPVTPNGHDHTKTKRVNKMLIIGHQFLYVFMLANKVGAECQTETKFNKKVQYNTCTTNIIWSQSDIRTDYTIHPMAAQISLFKF